MDEIEQQLRIKVTEKIGEVEGAVECLQGIRKNLLQNAYDTKRTILESFINQRDLMQSREMVLLSQVDSLLRTKDDALVTQLAKLNQVLGCLRNCLQSDHPCGDCLEKYEDLDLDPVADMSIEFTSAGDTMKRAINCYGELSGDMPDDVTATPVSTTQYNEEIESAVTEWLLTPTNIKRCDAKKVKTGLNEIMTTGWLLEHHSSSPSNAITAGRLFTNVKADDRGCWLRPDVTAAAADSSLATHTHQHFIGVRKEAHQEWLLPEVGEAPSMCTDSINEESASCTSSSCVIIPSHLASECSSYVMANSWLRHSPLPPLSHQPSYGINNWVATCTPTNDGDWLAPTRQHLISMSSLASEIGQLQMNTEENCWLVQKEESSMYAHERASDTSSQSWLVLSEEQFVDDNRLASTVPEWLPIPKKLQIAEQDFGNDEKHDVAPEKNSTSGDDWLLSNRTSNSQQQWYPNNAESYATTSKAALKETKYVDRNWLVVVNTLSQIAYSEQSNWLV